VGLGCKISPLVALVAALFFLALRKRLRFNNPVDPVVDFRVSSSPRRARCLTTRSAIALGLPATGRLSDELKDLKSKSNNLESSLLGRQFKGGYRVRSRDGAPAARSAGSFHPPDFDEYQYHPVNRLSSDRLDSAGRFRVLGLQPQRRSRSPTTSPFHLRSATVDA